MAASTMPVTAITTHTTSTLTTMVMVFLFFFFFRLARLRRLCGSAVSLAGGLCLGGMVSGTGLLAVIGSAGLVAAVVGVVIGGA